MNKLIWRVCEYGGTDRRSVLASGRGAAGRPVRIGVLGGIGPEATAEYYTKLISRLQEDGLVSSNRDYPQVIVNSIPAPELIHENIPEEDLVPYVDGLRELDGFGVDFIVMVCNTIHLYYDILQEKVDTPILDLRKELENYLKEIGVERALLIGTPSTVKRGLYDFEGIETLRPTDSELELLSRAIFDFNRGHEKEEQVGRVINVCKKYIANGAEMVILGCTEFAVMLENEQLPVVNTIDILVDSTIRRFLAQKHRFL